MAKYRCRTVFHFSRAKVHFQSQPAENWQCVRGALYIYGMCSAKHKSKSLSICVQLRLLELPLTQLQKKCIPPCAPRTAIYFYYNAPQLPFAGICCAFAFRSYRHAASFTPYAALAALKRLGTMGDENPNFFATPAAFDSS